MVAFKKHIFKISLLLILFSAAFLCIYSLWNYNKNNSDNGNNLPAQSRTEPRNLFQGEKNQPSSAPDQIQRKQSSNAGPNRNLRAPNNRNWTGISKSEITYAPQLIIYSVLFLVIFIVFYYLLQYKKLKIPPDHKKLLIFILLCVGLLLRLYSATLMEGHPFDINTFKSWATSAANNLFQFYSGPRSSDYPPLYIYVLFLIGKITVLPAVSHYYTLLLKLPSIAADIITSYLIYKYARKRLSPNISVLLSAFYIFNPAVFINSAFWGQVDSFFTLFIFSSMIMLSEKKFVLSSVLLMAAVMMKPQGIIFLPVLFFELVRQKSFSTSLKVLVCSLGTAFIIVLPFSLNEGGLWIFNLFSKTMAEYPYASVNAFNFFSLIGKNYTNDATAFFIFSYHIWGMIFIVLITAFSWFIYIKGNSSIFASAASLLLIAGVFTFSTRMHERYLFPAAALSILTFIYLKDKRLLILLAAYSVTIFINTYFVLFETIKGVNFMPMNIILTITSLLNVILFFYLAKILFAIAIKSQSQREILIGNS